MPPIQSFAVQDIVHHGHEEERHHRGVNQTADGHDRHGLNHFHPFADAQRHGEHGQHRRHGRHQNRPHTGLSAENESFGQLHPFGNEAVHIVHQNDPVVDDDAAEHQEAEKRHNTDIKTKDKQGEETAGKGQRNGKHHDEGRSQRLELSDHNQIHQHQRQGNGQHQILHIFADRCCFTADFHDNPVGNIVIFNQLFNFIADGGSHGVGGDRHGDGHVTLLIGTVNGGRTVFHGDFGNIAHFGFAVLPFHFDIGDIIDGGFFLLAVDDKNGVLRTVHRHRRCRVIRGDLLRHRLIDLRDGKSLLHGGVFIHGDHQLRGGRFHIGNHFFHTVHRRDIITQFLGKGGHFRKIVAFYRQLHTETAQHGHGVGAGGDFQLTAVFFRGGGQFLIQFIAFGGMFFIQFYIDGNVFRVAAGHHGHGTAGIAAHGTDGLHAVDLQRRFGHGVGGGVKVRGTHIFIFRGQRSRQLRGIVFRHKGEPAAAAENNAEDQNHTDHNDGPFPSVQHFAKELFITGVELRKEGHLFAAAFFQHAGSHGRNHRQRHDQAGDQRKADGEPHIHKELFTHAVGKGDGNKDADRRQC